MVLVMLLLTAASAHQSPSIANMLVDTSYTMPTPSPAQPGRYVGPYQALNPPGSLGRVVGTQSSKRSPIMESLSVPRYKKKEIVGELMQPLSQESRLIVTGMVEAFMHKMQLSRVEKRCLERNLGTITADIVGTAEDIYKAVKGIMDGRPGLGSNRSKSQVNLISSGIDVSVKITSLITVVTTLLKDCVQGDALEMLKTTGKHFIDMQYLGHRLLVSGVDVAHRLSDGIIAFEGMDWQRFGADIGIVLRKVLLSNSTVGSRLPEGMPDQVIIQETMAGLMSGFFVSGSGMEITDTAIPDVDIQLDLHRCVEGNQEFFKEVWLAMWHLISQLSLGVGNHGLQNAFASLGTGSADGSQPKWMSELMIAMMQVPMALSRCNIDHHAQQMLTEAIQSIKYVKVHFLFPRPVVTAEEATKKMARAVQAWTNWNFKGFGKQLGKLLREFVLLLFPQQYSVDPDGHLRRQLNSKALLPQRLQLTSQSLGRNRNFAIGGGTLFLLVTLVAVRGVSSMRRQHFLDSSSVHRIADYEMGCPVFEGGLLEVE